MSETTTVKERHFIDSHVPVLQSGLYRLDVEQKVDTKDASDPFKASKSFFVSGERYHLNPLDVYSVFPPAESAGDHSDVLPHIVLNRSTLPWERTSENERGWLALLLFDETEIQRESDEPRDKNKAVSSVVELSELEEHYRMSEEPGQHPTDRVSVVDVPNDLVKKLLPTAEDLKLLTHVRKVEESPIEGVEKAVILSNRLVKKEKKWTAHLVSLEGCSITGLINNSESNQKTVRFVSLKSWVFLCPEHYRVSESAIQETEAALNPVLPEFTEVKKDLESQLGQSFWGFENFKKALPNASQLPDGSPLIKELKEKFAFGQFSEIVRHLNRNKFGITCDEGLEARAKRWLEHGYLPLQHQMRAGESSACWYKGPLQGAKTTTSSPFAQEATFTLPKTSDQLLRYDKSHGMFDVSFAAAWELGRLLSLQARVVSVSLENWKRDRIHDRKAEEMSTVQTFLSPCNAKLEAELPEEVSAFFNNLTLLKKIPFLYLVPGENLLPPESVRFFTIDPLWMDYLKMGAFSIGAAGISDWNHLSTIYKQTLKENEASTLSGALLRSQVVSGWPDLILDGFAGRNQLTTLRHEILGDEVVLVIFKGELKKLVVHQKPEAMHFGSSQEGETVNLSIIKKEMTDKESSAETANQLTVGIQKVLFELQPA